MDDLHIPGLSKYFIIRGKGSKKIIHLNPECDDDGLGTGGSAHASARFGRHAPFGSGGHVASYPPTSAGGSGIGHALGTGYPPTSAARWAGESGRCVRGLLFLLAGTE